MNRAHVRKRIARIRKNRDVLLRAEAIIMGEAESLRDECHSTFVSLWKQHGFRGQPDTSCYSFQCGIVAKTWEPGAYMVLDSETTGPRNEFCGKVAKVAPAFYRVTGIKLCVHASGRKFVHLPK